MTYHIFMEIDHQKYDFMIHQHAAKSQISPDFAHYLP